MIIFSLFSTFEIFTEKRLLLEDFLLPEISLKSRLS